MLPSAWTGWTTTVTPGGARGPSARTDWVTATTPAHLPWRLITSGGQVALVPYLVE